MTVFACKQCGATLTGPLSRVALPVHAHQHYRHGGLRLRLMEPGEYAMDPEPPWGPPDAFLLTPGDAHGAEIIAGRHDGHCCGLAGDSPNLACARCGQPIAILVDDCGHWQAMWLDSTTVSLVDDGTDQPPAGWESLRVQRPGLPPVEAAGWWSPIWAAAMGDALARLLALSGGSPVSVPGGLLAHALRRSLNRFLGQRPQARSLSLALAGPGLPAVTADIALVPQHPQTGETWMPSGESRAVRLHYDVWAYLAFNRDRWPVSGAGAMPDEARRDDPAPPLPPRRFRPDSDVFLSTLATLPELSQPWLRAIYDQVRARPYQDPF
jgi:hypothetical protein